MRSAHMSSPAPLRAIKTIHTVVWAFFVARAVLWHRAIGALLDQGYVPQVRNEAASFISARRREDFENDPLARTLALVYISPDGAVRVEVRGVGLFASEKQFLSAIGERQRVILDLILNRSAGPAQPH